MMQRSETRFTSRSQHCFLFGLLLTPAFDSQRYKLEDALENQAPGNQTNIFYSLLLKWYFVLLSHVLSQRKATMELRR